MSVFSQCSEAVENAVHCAPCPLTNLQVKAYEDSNVPVAIDKSFGFGRNEDSRRQLHASFGFNSIFEPSASTIQSQSVALGDLFDRLHLYVQRRILSKAHILP